uniref:Uncharacterized protein n=1 Tax=Rhizophora mucronata TaxID=61149 RepID=A0A2P2P808_RHIMU
MRARLKAGMDFCYSRIQAKMPTGWLKRLTSGQVP